MPKALLLALLVGVLSLLVVIVAIRFPASGVNVIDMFKFLRSV